MIKVQMLLYKTDVVIAVHLCNFSMVSTLKWYTLLIPWPFGIRLIYMPTPLGLQRAYISGKSFVAMVLLLIVCLAGSS